MKSYKNINTFSPLLLSNDKTLEKYFRKAYFHTYNFVKENIGSQESGAYPVRGFLCPLRTKKDIITIFRYKKDYNKKMVKDVAKISTNK